MNIIFAGTPEFSVPVLKSLLNTDQTVVAVYTQPDRPAGRGRRVQASPVKQLAEQHGLPVRQPATLRKPDIQAALQEFNPDLMIVVAYGLLLPAEVLSMPRLGCVNIHASLLPRWRGAAPIQKAILEGDIKTGVSLMQMDEGLDTGEVLAQAECSIKEHETASSLHDRLSVLGAELLIRQLPGLLAGELSPHPQKESEASYAGKIVKADACLDWGQTADHLGRMVRAFNPWPVAFTGLEEKVLRVWQAQIIDKDLGKEPGTVVAASSAGIDVACGKGGLRLLKVQLPGGRQLSARDFVNANSLTGVRLQSVS